MFFCVGEQMKVPSFIPSNDLLKEILTMIIKVEEMSEGCTHMVFLVVLCQLSRDPPAAHFSVPWTFVNNIPDCAMWKVKLFFQLFKQHLAIGRHSLLNCRGQICWYGRMPTPLFICHTHVTATKFPTSFSHMLHGHHIRAIKCSNFTMNFSWNGVWVPEDGDSCHKTGKIDRISIGAVPLAPRNWITDWTPSCVPTPAKKTTHTHTHTHARARAHTHTHKKC